MSYITTNLAFATKHISKMVRVLLLLTLAVAATANLPNLGPRRPTDEGLQDKFDEANDGIEYHFSWVHNKHGYSGWGAKDYCQKLDHTWMPLKINDVLENNYIASIVGANKKQVKEGIWTGGQRNGNNFVWYDNTDVMIAEAGLAMPDSNEAPRDCMAVMAKGNGIEWYAEECKYAKPTICERPEQ